MSSFSIVVTTYNQEYEKICLTIDSILAQTLEEIEIVIADDGSRQDYLRELSEYLKVKGFSNFKMVKNSDNIGTVKNAISGLEAAKSDYAMLLSPGDLLADRKVLERMRAYISEEKAVLVSGIIRRYSYDGTGKVLTADYYMGDVEELEKGIDSLLEQQLVYTRWASGGSLFFDRAFILEYMKELAEGYNVRYCEDLVAPLITLNKVKLEAFEEQIIWYEWGVGISNSGDIGNIKRMYTDYRNFYDGIMRYFRNNAVVKKAYRRFILKETISKCTPIYLFLRKLVGIVGRDHMNVMDGACTEKESFLLEMLRMNNK